MALATGKAVWGGIASIVIGAILWFIAIILARESKYLLPGEAADRELADTLRTAVEGHPEVQRVTDIVTVQIGVDQVFAAVSVEFPDDMKIPELEKPVSTTGAQVRQRRPEVTRVFVRPERGNPRGGECSESPGAGGKARVADAKPLIQREDKFGFLPPISLVPQHPDSDSSAGG